MKPVRSLPVRPHKFDLASVARLSTALQTARGSRRSHLSIRPKYSISTPLKPEQNGISTLQTVQKRSISGFVGSSVMSPFIKSSYLFWGLPICVALEPFINPFPFDLFFGAMLPYHAYVGMNHIATDYFPHLSFISYLVAGVMLVGIQNYNLNGEGLIKSVRRLFVSKPLPIGTAATPTKEQTLADTYKSKHATPWTELNSDKTKDALVDTNDVEWTQSPANGVSRKMIERLGDEVARCTTIVKYEPNKSFPSHVHSGGEEFIILDGVWRDEFGTFGKNTYCRNYIGSKHTPRIGEEGCVILVKLRQMSEDLVEPNHTNIDATVSGESGTKVLYESKYEKVSVEKWPSNSKFEINIPEDGKEIFVIDGSFGIEELGQNVAQWSWARYTKQGSVMQAVAGKEGCYFYVKERHLNSPEVGVPNQPPK